MEEVMLQVDYGEEWQKAYDVGYKQGYADGISARFSDVPSGMKRCVKCGKILPIEMFGICKKYKDGHQSRCRSCFNEYRREYAESHSETEKARRKRYRDSHKEYFKERHKDPVKLESDIVRSAIRLAFCKNSEKACNKVATITGKSPKELTQYLLETFYKIYGREWDGVESVWIDHIIPLSTAQTVDDVHRLSHYSNLQLLTEKDNRRKANKMDLGTA